MATRYFAYEITNNQPSSPIKGGTRNTLAKSIEFFRAFLAGTRGRGVSIVTKKDRARASATLSDNGLVALDVAGAAINGVAATATYASSVNNTLLLIRNKVNAGGDTPNDLITKAVYATRTLVDAEGTYTIDDTVTGTITATVGGTAVAVSSTEGDVLASAQTLAAAINAQATAGAKVFATVSLDGDDAIVTLTAQATNRATITLSSAAGVVGCYIGGIPVSVTYATSDANTATLLTTEINSSTDLMNLVRAVNSASGVVTIISRTAGDQMPAIGVRGTNVTLGGVTTPAVTFTFATASGTVTAYVNGLPIASITATGTDATDVAAMVAEINSSRAALEFGVRAVATSSTVVTVYGTSSSISLTAFGTGTTASAPYLGGAGTWGGVAGNAVLTVAAGTGLTADQASLEGGTSAITVTATAPGVGGNWITFAASGAGAAHVTASSARLVSGTETLGVIAYPE